jgi:hypothetical protein
MIAFAPLIFCLRVSVSHMRDLQRIRRRSETGYPASGIDLHQEKWRSFETGVIRDRDVKRDGPGFRRPGVIVIMC